MALTVALLKLAWKFLGPAVTALALKLGEEAFQALREMLKTKQSERRAQAQQKAQAAETRARQSSDANEATALQAHARIWCEVAEQFAQDNKAQQAEMNTLKTEMETRGRAQARALPLAVGRTADMPPSPQGEQRQPKIGDKQ